MIKKHSGKNNENIVEETVKPNYLNVILFALFIIMLMYGMIFFVYKNMKDKKDEQEKQAEAIITTFEETMETTEPPLYNYNYMDVISADKISAKTAILYNASTNTILFEKSPDERCYPASTTKLITAMTALKNVSPDAVFTVGSEIQMIGENSSTAYLVEGSALTLRDLIYAMLLPSGNDAAYCVAVNTARNVSGNPDMTNEEAVAFFCNLMNNEAIELKMDDSHFANPDGWYKYNHYLTASDMLKVVVEIQKNYPVIQQVAMTPEYSVKSSTDGVLYVWQNNNKMLEEESDYYFPYSKGLKTGFTDECGYCYAATAEKDGVELVALLFGSATIDDRYRDAKNLFNTVYEPGAIILPSETFAYGESDVPENADISEYNDVEEIAEPVA